MNLYQFIHPWLAHHRPADSAAGSTLSVQSIVGYGGAPDIVLNS